MKTLLIRTDFSKRSGHPIHEVVYALVLRVWLQKEFIGMFAREAVQDGRSIVAKQQTEPEIVKPWFIVLYIAILKQIICFLRETTTKHLLLFK